MALVVGGTSITVAERGARLVPFSVSSDDPVLEVEMDGQGLTYGPLATRTQKARLNLRSTQPCRWSVMDDSGGSWFPEGHLQKWDYHHRPFFHGADIELDVPAAASSVSAPREGSSTARPRSE